MKETITKGCYLLIKCCIDCSWAAKPMTNHRGVFLPPCPRVICPDCGGDLKLMKGRYVIKDTTKRNWLGIKQTKTEITGFDRRKAK